ncbi:hybrid sensor histidine kinase/response regulator [Noviherbaspirillum sp. Root189]|uniref:hybrid sensor histidine kinase/response regulator n=1 Tax=Noviherbaspirillum sp. Root189 TaxID=1736487 RepID=UPI00070D78B4|nr:ATP-binding protein [Noviherbaspirillum sp. Root189]KRB67963.1 ATPase [Noviherbaspirillum sp. Root189]
MEPRPQTIFRIRRDYNTWVANETLEDYALRYTPHSARKWSEMRVANTALGAISFLALEAIGAAIALKYGFSNALWAILVVSAVIFLTAFPIAVYAARTGLDMDLLTRGAGFGYLGSTVTSLIYASFTFIFFALEAAIMALALQMAIGWPIFWCYVISALVVIPLVLHGITFISRLQAWTQGIWAALLLWPFLWLSLNEPDLFIGFTTMAGFQSGSSRFDPLMFGAATTVAFSLVVQIGEQVDYLRFMPERTRKNRMRWWFAVVLAGPGWIVPGMLKMLAGAFLAYVALQSGGHISHAAEPTWLYLNVFERILSSPLAAVAVTVAFVVISQVKINVTNAYAGSIAWSNFFSRLTRSHPGRVVWLVFNVVIAMLLMTLGVFSALEKVLGLYANVAIAWVGALLADLVINKPLGLSPRHIEFRRAYLYDINPVGLGAMLLATAVGCLAHSGLWGESAAAFAPFLALITAVVTSPLLAWWTGGRYYLARVDVSAWRPTDTVRCVVCHNQFEAVDMASCPSYGGPICSLCCSLESRCHDRCKTGSRAAEQMLQLAAKMLPRRLHKRFNFRVAQYFTVFLSLCIVIAFVLSVVFIGEPLEGPPAGLATLFIKLFLLLAVVAAACAWWVVLANESRRIAHDESERQNQLLQQEIDAHQRTDSSLQQAKELAEAASQAKTRYVAGITHELRTPLNSILGYAQILRRRTDLLPDVRDAVNTIHHSGQHMHGLIDGLLDLTRIEAGRLRLDLAALPFPEFLSQVARMVQPQAEAKGLRFTLQTQGRVPRWVRADAKRLRQILINLLANAVRYTEEGEIVFRVDCRHDVIRFEVQDTGIGIAPEDQERIFLPFERGPAGRRSSESGTGLGLTITHLITGLMGGELILDSAPGRGSTFTVRLHLSEIQAGSEQKQAAAHGLQTVVGYHGPRLTMLIVDDQLIQRQLLASLLMPLGFTVREAASGRECLELMTQISSDIILMDLNMGDMDGWQTARALRGANVQVPIVIISADLFENSASMLEETQCQGFVGKPVVESELLDILARTLRIQWVRETHCSLQLDGLANGAQWSQAIHLPAMLRQELFHLARIGHGSGLRQRLRTAAAEQPLMRAEIEVLQRMAERFDFESIVTLLKEIDDEREDARS